MAIQYPKGLPLPLRANYRFTPTNNIVRTSMDSGRARQRVEFENVPSIATMGFIFNEVQARLFESWAYQVAKGSWFFIRLLTPMGFDEVEVRFTKTPDGGQLLGQFLWQYDCEVEVRKPPRLEPGWAELLPDYVLHADIFDRAMNREWPEAVSYRIMTEQGQVLTTEDGFELTT